MIQIHPTVLIIICGALVGAIGFFTGGFIMSSNKAQQKLTDTVARLDNSITRLDTTITGIKEANERFDEVCKERHTTIDSRLNSHSKRLDSVGAKALQD
jgi:hypothetical protein